MTCLTRYAEAIDYAAFFCLGGGYVSGVDNSAHVNDLNLTDTTMADFAKLGIQANVGMRLYNITKGTYGPVTAVTATTLTATGVLWTGGDAYRIAALDNAERSIIEAYLDITAADINAALSSVGACSCTLDTWALELLKKINIIEAVSFHVCSCAKPNLADDRKQSFLDWANSQFELIRNGQMELCSGHTGSNYPAVGVIQVGNTVWTEEQMIINAKLKGLP